MKINDCQRRSQRKKAQKGYPKITNVITQEASQTPKTSSLNEVSILLEKEWSNNCSGPVDYKNIFDCTKNITKKPYTIRLITYKGETAMLKKLALKYGVSYPTASCRLRKGYPLSEVFNKYKIRKPREVASYRGKYFDKYPPEGFKNHQEHARFYKEMEFTVKLNKHIKNVTEHQRTIFCDGADSECCVYENQGLIL